MSNKKPNNNEIPEYQFIHQISMKYYQNWDDMLDKIRFYISRYFRNMKPYLEMTDEVFKKYKIDEVLSGDIVNEWDGSLVYKIDFRDFNDPETMLETLLISLKVFFTSPELRKRNLVIHLVHHILPF
ncbi:MAG: hypothetical protein RLZZ236_1953 [Bacteroidota bacterium]|jgi:hypothetical protein